MNRHIHHNTYAQIHSPFASSESQLACFLGLLQIFYCILAPASSSAVAGSHFTSSLSQVTSVQCFVLLFLLCPDPNPMLGSSSGSAPRSEHSSWHIYPSWAITIYCLHCGRPSSHLLRMAVLPESTLCCQQLALWKHRQPMPGDPSTRGSWVLRWQLQVICLQNDFPWALILLNIFAALRGLSAPRSQGQLARGVLQRLGPTGSDSIYSLSVF